MGNKFTTPSQINFPEIKETNWVVSVQSQKESNEGKNATSMWLLKSGNILISYFMRDERQFKVRSYLAIFNIPDLKLIEKYEYDGEIDESLYIVNAAAQSKDGNIFMIGDQLYIFDGEVISQGPSKNSEEINDVNLYTIPFQFFEPDDKKEKYPIKKKAKIFCCDFLLEVKEGIFLYTETTFSNNELIFLLDISKSKIERNDIFYYDKITKNGNYKYTLDIILQSEYYPENLYICANYTQGQNYESVLLCFNIENFLNQKNATQEPLFTIQASDSEKIFGFCEYDKKYILLDSYTSGIYIVDIELKQKVALSVPKTYLKEIKSFYNPYKDRKTDNGTLYRKIIKLKDGQVFIDGHIINIREQRSEDKIRGPNFFKFLTSGEYIIYYFKSASILIYQIKEEEKEE